MATVLLVVHLMIAAALVAVVLLQRSEGGALGIGGGGGGAGGFMTGRGTANMLTRVTAGLAAAFFVTSICLTLLAQQTRRAPSPLDRPAAGAPAVPGPATKSDSPPAAPGTPSGAPGGGLLDSLQQGRQQLPQVPASR
jgi:preprotein translocase subunit SecG